MIVRVFDVEHGACALIESPNNGRIALVDCGTNSTTDWNPAEYLEQRGRTTLDYLLITNPDEDHYCNLAHLKDSVDITTFIKNPTLNEPAFRNIKEENGALSDDAETYASMLTSYTAPVPMPFDQGMGGITLKTFWNSYPTFSDTNNLSLACFIHYSGFQILFPGDLEAAGWTELLKSADFRSELQKTTILVASHHGRQNGFHAPVFQYCKPQAIVISDKPKLHETQETVPQYQNILGGDGVNVMGQNRKRHVLTTRKDGPIRFFVAATNYTIQVG